MTLEELKAAWDAAVAALNAAPKEKALIEAEAAAKAAYEEAKAKADAEPPKDDDPDDQSKWSPEKTKAYIDKLRKENATHRNKNKELASQLKLSEEQKKGVLKAIGIESDDEKPEEKLKALTSESQQLAFRNAILESAVQHGIPADKVKYYQFLVVEATNELEEGEELSDEKMEEIIKEAKSSSKGSNSTSVGKGGKDGKQPPKPGESGDISLDQFCRMTMIEKSNLYLKQPDTYKALLSEAKAKKRLV